ncbi:hypothetical protein [Actinoplanes teichomyceticus]|uniref:hypothetical protein n=1 Tax=Actinoplanes teichomyceticus TaxID=1867 RepID=UPI0011A88245|nr:hypothetical protein [Actinoplanes teichomyceticus]
MLRGLPWAGRGHRPAGCLVVLTVEHHRLATAAAGALAVRHVVARPFRADAPGTLVTSDGPAARPAFGGARVVPVPARRGVVPVAGPQVDGLVVEGVVPARVVAPRPEVVAVVGAVAARALDAVVGAVAARAFVAVVGAVPDRLVVAEPRVGRYPPARRLAALVPAAVPNRVGVPRPAVAVVPVVGAVVPVVGVGHLGPPGHRGPVAAPRRTAPRVLLVPARAATARGPDRSEVLVVPVRDEVPSALGAGSAPDRRPAVPLLRSGATSRVALLRLRNLRGAAPLAGGAAPGRRPAVTWRKIPYVLVPADLRAPPTRLRAVPVVVAPPAVPVVVAPRAAPVVVPALARGPWPCAAPPLVRAAPAVPGPPALVAVVGRLAAAVVVGRLAAAVVVGRLAAAVVAPAPATVLAMRPVPVRRPPGAPVVVTLPAALALGILQGRRIHDREVRLVEVHAQFGTVEVDVVEVVAGQVVDGGVDRYEVRIVQPARTVRVEGVRRLPATVRTVGGRLVTVRIRSPGGDDRVGGGPLLVVALLDHRVFGHQRVLVVLVVPVLVVLEAHAAASLRPGNVPPPRRRICATVLTWTTSAPPVPAPRAPGSTARHVVDVEG